MHCIPRIPDLSFVNSLKNKYITRDEVRNVAPHDAQSVWERKKMCRCRWTDSDSGTLSLSRIKLDPRNPRNTIKLNFIVNSICEAEDED